MSRLRTDPRRRDDGGFTLVEVLVAFAIFAIAAAALLPLLLVAAKTASTAKLETQAKNLTQQQTERMRNLAFHVDHQNGDYVDLLDLYYSNVSTAAVTLTPSTARPSTPYGDADGQVMAQFMAEAGGVDGRPTGPAYRISSLQMDGYPEFSLEVYTQFLRTTRTVAAAAANYDSQVASLDSPPTQLVGVTVIVTWNDSNGSSLLRTYTEMAEGRGGGSLLSTQARSTALKVSGTSATNQPFLAQAGVVQADGSVTTGSAASAAAEAARLEQIGVDTVLGRTTSVAAPPDAGTAGLTSTDAPVSIAGASTNPCGWASVGRTQLADVTSATGSAQPKAPKDGGDDVRAAGAKRVQAGVVVGGTGCGGYAFRVRPDSDGLWTPPAAYGVDATRPVVGIRDGVGSSTLTDAAARGAGQVAASPIVVLPIFSSAHASAGTRQIEVLPVTGHPTGVVRVTLDYARMTCVSGVGTSGEYKVTIQHPPTAANLLGTTTRTWSSTSGTPVAALPDPAGIPLVVGTTTRTLDDYLNWEVAGGISEGDNGVSSFGPALRVTLKAAALGTSTDMTIELGVLSCAADDRR